MRRGMFPGNLPRQGVTARSRRGRKIVLRSSLFRLCDSPQSTCARSRSIRCQLVGRTGARTAPRRLTMRRAAVLAAAAFAAALSNWPSASAQASDMYLGQLMMVGFNFCPRGWTEADGQILAISTNSALFSLYGTTYGGNGQTTFALPDLRGRVPAHVGQGPGLAPVTQGQVMGADSTTLTLSQMPMHNHLLMAPTTPCWRPSAAPTSTAPPAPRMCR